MPKPNYPPPDTDHPHALGSLLDRLVELTGDGRVHVSDLMTGLGQTSFIPLLVVPAMIILSPLSIVPTLPTICGLMIALISIQMLLGRSHLWLPQFILRRSVNGGQLHAALRWLRKPAGWIDQIVAHRLESLVSTPFSGLLVATCMLAGAAMPLLEILPFASSVLAAAICLIAIGLMVRDGVVALMGLGVMWLGFALICWLVAAANT